MNKCRFVYTFVVGGNRLARSGKKVRISEEIARELRVGDINDGSVMHKTALYSSEQYRAVNSSNWDSKVFVMNDNK